MQGTALVVRSTRSTRSCVRPVQTVCRPVLFFAATSFSRVGSVWALAVGHNHLVIEFPVDDTTGNHSV